MDQPRSNRPWFFILIGFLVGTLVGFGLLSMIGVLDLRSIFPGGLEKARTSVPLPGVGSPAPDFTLTDLDGEPIKLSALRGQLVVLNFWATWCEPCRAEMPELERIYQQYQPGLVVLGVNLQEQPEDVRRFTRSINVTYPILLDPDGLVARLYKIIQLPNTYFIDRQGTIQARHIGSLSAEKLQEYLDSMGVSE